jgi:hypothetical protein
MGRRLNGPKGEMKWRKEKYIPYRKTKIPSVLFPLAAALFRL